MRGEPATLVLWAPDYDGTNKAWVRFPDGRTRSSAAPRSSADGLAVCADRRDRHSARAGLWAEWAREEDFGGGWHSIGDHLGIEGFGVNANTADAGRELIVPHDEVAYGGQEELYIVLRGRARFTCDGEEVELGPGEMLLVTHEVRREAVALEAGTSCCASAARRAGRTHRADGAAGGASQRCAGRRR